MLWLLGTAPLCLLMVDPMENNQPGNWPRIGNTTTLAEQVYAVVRRRLVNGDFPPKTYIREAELGTAMGVSRTPVREALNRLASEGFIEQIPHRGFQVPEQSIESLVHLYPVLGALEALAGELAFPKLTEDDLRELEEINGSYAAALLSNQVTAAVEWNEEFHRRLSRMSGNPILCNLLDEMRARIRRLEVWDFSHLLSGTGGPSPALPPDEWPRQHAAVLDAVRRRDFERARDLLGTNRSLSFQAEMKQLSGLEQPVVAEST